MYDLILYLLLAFIGYILASKYKDKKEKFSWTGKVQTISIVILVLSMGMRMGANREVIDNLKEIGLSALLFTIIIFIFVIVTLNIVRKFLKLNKYGLKVVKNSEKEKVAFTFNKMTLYIVIAILIGMGIGFFIFLPLIEKGILLNIDSILGNVIRIGLCVLLLFVGLDLGFEGNIFGKIKSMGLKIIIFPIFTVLATIIGGIVSGLILNLSMKESLAISCGFGWYSLAPGLIIEAGFVKASAIAFLHNVLRETFSIIFIPFIAQRIGYIEVTGLPGAAAMDVCLPVIEKSTSADISIYGFCSGVILSLLVPILVPLILSI